MNATYTQKCHLSSIINIAEAEQDFTSSEDKIIIQSEGQKLH